MRVLDTTWPSISSGGTACTRKPSWAPISVSRAMFALAAAPQGIVGTHPHLAQAQVPLGYSPRTRGR